MNPAVQVSQCQLGSQEIRTELESDVSWSNDNLYLIVDLEVAFASVPEVAVLPLEAAFIGRRQVGLHFAEYMASMPFSGQTSIRMEDLTGSHVVRQTLLVDVRYYDAGGERAPRISRLHLPCEIVDDRPIRRNWFSLAIDKLSHVQTPKSRQPVPLR